MVEAETDFSPILACRATEAVVDDGEECEDVSIAYSYRIVVFKCHSVVSLMEIVETSFLSERSSST